MKTTIFAICALMASLSYAEYNPDIPEQAFQYKDTIESEIENNFPDLPAINYIPALIEHESCLSLTHSRCWSPTARRFVPGREEGVGLGQITRTWRSDGTIRFDSLTSMQAQYREELNELSWSNVRNRPDLQIRLITLMVRDNYNNLWDVENPMIRLQMANAAYNGGPRMLKRERQVCQLAAGCDPSIWFNNVENHCVRSTLSRNGRRSPCEINRHHTEDVFTFRLPRYQDMYFTQEEKDAVLDEEVESNGINEPEPGPEETPDTDTSTENNESEPRSEESEQKSCRFSWCFCIFEWCI